MKQVLDNQGNPIKGLYKNKDGSIIVNDPESYKKAMLESNREKEFDLLKQKVGSMESMVLEIYNKLMKKD